MSSNNSFTRVAGSFGIALVLTGLILPETTLARTTTSSTSAEIRALRAELARTRAETKSEIDALRTELSKTRNETRVEARQVDQKIQLHEQQVDKKLDDVTKEEKVHRNLVFFRGGYASQAESRSNELLINNQNTTTLTPGHEGNTNGWYVGAGFDFNLTPNVWGLWNGAEVDAELMFEYKDFGATYNELVSFVSPLTIKINISIFALTASPKIKFTGLGDFKPWIIPFGLGMYVINPPSSGVTYLNPGVVFGVGGEYKIWNDWYVGADFRYNVTGNNFGYRAVSNGKTVLNSTSIDGLTAGGYFGFGF